MKTTLQALFFTLFLCLFQAGFSQNPIYSRVQVKADDIEPIHQLLALDHIHAAGSNLTLEITQSELSILDHYGISYEVLIKDLTTYYQEQNEVGIDLRSEDLTCTDNDHVRPRNFKLGSMAGYLTYDEILDELDLMHQLYPDIVSAKSPISTFKTYEGRSIFYVKIGNEQTTRRNKPNILYTALHHAREPLSMQQLIYYMWYLLENYESDDMVKQIIDQSFLYFIPCLNPDGYVYNGNVAPRGGGMWRKNRRPITNDHIGVDLNRNYGYQWGYNEDGSSSDPGADTYRGPAPFSEAETQAIKWLCENIEIDFALNYHGFGDYLIYPWGYNGQLNSKNAMYQALAKGISFDKRILYGTSQETVLYNTNGDSDDWMFGETGTKKSIIALTPEVGPAHYGFWPPKAEILLLCQRELQQNLSLAIAAQNFVLIEQTSEPIFTDHQLKHKFYLYLLGKESAGIITNIKPLTSNINSYEESVYIVGNNSKEEFEVALGLSSELSEGEIIEFELAFTNGYLTQTDTITYVYSESVNPIVLLEDEIDFSQWTRSDQSQWNDIHSEYFSAPSSITDSPNGHYTPNSVNVLQSSSSFLVPSSDEVYLSYRVKWDIISNLDYARLMISTDGHQYEPLCGRYTSTFFEYGNDFFPAYTGTQEDWLTEIISLKPYSGQEVFFRWEMVANSGLTADGIYIDDMKINYSSVMTATRPQVEKVNSINIFPNPSSQREAITVSFEDMRVLEKYNRWMVRNSLGQEVSSGKMTTPISSSSFQIPTQNWAPGLYFFYLATDRRLTSPQKFLILD